MVDLRAAIIRVCVALDRTPDSSFLGLYLVTLFVPDLIQESRVGKMS